MNVYKVTIMHKILPEWNLYYIDYDYLEELIHIRKNNPINKAVHEERIAKEVEAQLMKVNSYFHHLLTELETKITNFRVNLTSNSIGNSRASREKIQLEMNAIQTLFNNISSFCEVNYEAFCNIIEYHDHVTQNRISPWFLRRLKDQKFYQYSIPLGKLLVRFSDCCSQGRQLTLPSDFHFNVNDVKKSQSFHSFERETRTFLVKKEDLVKVKTEIVKHMPLCLYNGDCKNKERCDATPIHSVYIENADTLENFAACLRKTSANCIRLRTLDHPKYLENYPREVHPPSLPTTVYVERKSYNANVGQYTDRLEISPEDAFDFLKGKYSINDYVHHLQQLSYTQKQIENSTKLFLEFQTAIRKYNLVPVISTQFDRTSYRLEGEEMGIEISIDSNVTMIKERMKIMPGWYKENMEIDPDDAYLFPYSILQLNLFSAPGSQTPDWLQSLLSSGLLRRIDDFSKYIHGCCMLLPSKVPHTPDWVKEFPVPSHQRLIDFQNIENQVVEENQNDQALDDQSFLVPMSEQAKADRREELLQKQKEKEYFIRALEYLGISILEPDCDRPSKVPLKAEPKTFFANERTFLKWMTICLFIQAVGVAFLGFTDFGIVSFTTGIALIFVSILFMGYATTCYKVRAYRIKYYQSERFDDVYGPVALFAVLAIVILINAVFYIAQHVLAEESLDYYAD